MRQKPLRRLIAGLLYRVAQAAESVRVDAIFVPRFVVAAVQPQLDIDRPLSISDKPISTDSICYVARNDADGQALLKRINTAVETLVSDGRWQELLPKAR